MVISFFLLFSVLLGVLVVFWCCNLMQWKSTCRGPSKHVFCRQRVLEVCLVFLFCAGVDQQVPSGDNAGLAKKNTGRFHVHSSVSLPIATKYDEDPAIFPDVVLDPELLRCTLVTKRPLKLECLT